MEISPRRSLSLDFDASAMSPAPSSYPPTYLNCRSNMYTMQGMKAPTEAKVTRSFGMTSSLSMDSGARNMLAPKKENFISNIFSALTSVVMEGIAKVPGSFMTNINSALSVTVVPNEGIISQEFFKTLTRSCEQLASEHHSESKEIPRISEKLPATKLYDSTSQKSYVFPDSARTDALSEKLSLDSQPIGETVEKSKEKESDCKVTCSVDAQEGSSKVCNVYSEMKGPRIETVALEEEGECPSVDRTETSTGQPSSRSAEPEAVEVPVKNSVSEDACSAGWQTMWRRVVNGVSDRFNPRSASPDSEVPPKKPNLAVYPHTKPRRKTCSVAARGRGKGRGKSQLRRSGVSQSRHRKERTKQNISSNIQDDLEAWEDSECYDSGNEDSLQGTREDEEQRSPCQDAWKHCSTLFENFTFDEPSKPRKRKQRTRDSAGVKCPSRVRYLPESSMEVDTCGSRCVDEHDCNSRVAIEFRPRLVSESSVDSEDSYCIVFESSSESEYTDYDYDSVSDEDLDSVSDEEGGHDDKTTPRVRFNLEPKVHPMVQWDYAYRAARRGPWEEMARDRERFRGKIRCIERVLEPILAPQHRKCVWQDRFDVDG